MANPLRTSHVETVLSLDAAARQESVAAECQSIGTPKGSTPSNRPPLDAMKTSLVLLASKDAHDGNRPCGLGCSTPIYPTCENHIAEWLPGHVINAVHMTSQHLSTAPRHSVPQPHCVIQTTAGQPVTLQQSVVGSQDAGSHQCLQPQVHCRRIMPLNARAKPVLLLQGGPLLEHERGGYTGYADSSSRT